MKYAQMFGRLKVKLLVTLPVGHGGRALDAGPPPPCNQLRTLGVRENGLLREERLNMASSFGH